MSREIGGEHRRESPKIAEAAAAHHAVIHGSS
jgi:hypothetical protein